MAKKVRFPLVMGNGVEIRSLEDLRKYFDLSKVLEFYKVGKLFNWLDVYYYSEEAEKVQNLNPESDDFVKQLCVTLGVEPPEEDVNYERIAERAERLERLKQYTSDEKILAMVDAVAFEQEELYDRLDEGWETIYLCGENISVPSGAKGRDFVDLLKREEVQEDIEEVVEYEDEERAEEEEKTPLQRRLDELTSRYQDDVDEAMRRLDEWEASKKERLKAYREKKAAKSRNNEL